jgi:hypothetical protein
MSGHSGARKAERIRVAVILAILIGAALGSFWVMQAMRASGDKQPVQRPRGKPDWRSGRGAAECTALGSADTSSDDTGSAPATRTSARRALHTSPRVTFRA